jgi:hypothetical protein
MRGSSTVHRLRTVVQETPLLYVGASLNFRFYDLLPLPHLLVVSVYLLVVSVNLLVASVYLLVVSVCDIDVLLRNHLMIFGADPSDNPYRRIREKLYFAAAGQVGILSRDCRHSINKWVHPYMELFRQRTFPIVWKMNRQLACMLD